MGQCVSISLIDVQSVFTAYHGVVLLFFLSVVQGAEGKLAQSSGAALPQPAE